MVKIKEYKIKRINRRIMQIALPNIWIRDQNFNVGDVICFYRTEDNKLILETRHKD